MSAPPRMVKLCDLWQRKSAKGTVYFSGFMGDAQVLLFKDGNKPHPTRPDETVIVWKLLVQERDSERRPKQRRDRGHQNDAPADGAATVHRFEREDPRQERINELAEAFDRRGPDEVPW